MAIPLPDVDELDLFSHDNLDMFTDDQKEQALQQAADLLFLATGLDEKPDDKTTARIVNWGLMDMAWSLLIKTENKTETYSPFASEHIGSYSYSKALNQINTGVATGVSWFDAAVTLLGSSEEGVGAVWMATEHVFKQPYTEDLMPTFPDAFGW